MSGTRYTLEVNPKLPPELIRLEELANNLWYSWHAATQALFARLDSKEWLASGHSPKIFLKHIHQHRLDTAAADKEFLVSLERVLESYDAYHSASRKEQIAISMKGELIAYFCAEFGFHESLPIYSGGLGILAGDHCKTASDMALPFVAVGLLYRQGYFMQTIDSRGEQEAQYQDSNFDDLPITPALQSNGEELHIAVELPGRIVDAKVWQVQVGTIKLYLLDTDIACNTEHDRYITHRLYGGDRKMRIEQEIILGIGGVRALKALGLLPTVWHINEGHAAFLILERIRDLMQMGLTNSAALEAVASNTVFTTHTAVPAGHDHFNEDMIRQYFSVQAEGRAKMELLLALGRTQESHEFNMTALAIRGSRHQNGVSRVHGEVSSAICAGFWPQIDAKENSIDYVTNGAHIPSFLSELWHDAFNHYLGHRWNEHLPDAAVWKAVEKIPDDEFWRLRQAMKSQMLYLLRYRLQQQHVRNYGSQAHIDRLLKYADPENPDVLTIGFARRFATYKRATLIFSDLDWLRRLFSNTKCPVLFVFAGKAHPADQPGQDLIRRIAEIAEMPEFEGRILLLEGYDLHLSRRLVAGVDVWLNNPLYPHEASGTSGMKAAFNGVINLSVLDGWWAEGFESDNGQPANGWAITPVSVNSNESQRNFEEARALYEVLQDKVIPLYYKRESAGYSKDWVRMAKQSMITIAPRFNSCRMVKEYATRFYQPAAQQWHKFSKDGFAGASNLAEWKKHVRMRWAGVNVRWIKKMEQRIDFGNDAIFKIGVDLNGLLPDEIKVELLLGQSTQEHESIKLIFTYFGVNESSGEAQYELHHIPDLCGKFEYGIRAYPSHSLLTHPFEMGLMKWIEDD